MSWLHPTDKHLLFTRNDKEDPRLGECVQLAPRGELQIPLDTPIDFAIVGYPDDEGISLNGGRPGAQAAPKEIRTFLYKMTPHLNSTRLPALFDLGDLGDREKALELRHERARDVARTLAQKKIKWISLGGGHDYGYCDGAGFLDVHQNNAVLINFDAHLDVRPTDKGFHSGTPFHRVLSEFSGAVDFAEIGIQNQCNSQSHIKWAQEKGAHIFPLDQVESEGLQSVLEKFVKGKEHKKFFISLDIDAFTSNEAPGCSQSWTTGLETKEFLKSFQWLIHTVDIVGLGLYEVSPPLDSDHRTSKLAALIAHHFIFSNLKKGSHE